MVSRARTCSSIQLAWIAPKNTGTWSAVEGYLVAYKPSDHITDESDGWLPEGSDFELEDSSVLSSLPLHRLTEGDQTSVELTELNGNTEYAVAVLPRNAYGWGHHWSVAAYLQTATDTLPPMTPVAPAVHPMDARCSEVLVEVPASEHGRCRRPSLFEVQLRAGHDSDDGTYSWTTVRRVIASPARELVRVRIPDPSQPFQMRLVAMNAKGSAPPSEATSVTPSTAHRGGCISDADFDPSKPLSPTTSQFHSKVTVAWQASTSEGSTTDTVRSESAPSHDTNQDQGDADKMSSGNPSVAKDSVTPKTTSPSVIRVALDWISEVVVLILACTLGGLGFIGMFRSLSRYLRSQSYTKVATISDEVVWTTKDVDELAWTKDVDEEASVDKPSDGRFTRQAETGNEGQMAETFAARAVTGEIIEQFDLMQAKDDCTSLMIDQAAEYQQAGTVNGGQNQAETHFSAQGDDDAIQSLHTDWLAQEGQHHADKHSPAQAEDDVIQSLHAGWLAHETATNQRQPSNGPLASAETDPESLIRL